MKSDSTPLDAHLRLSLDDYKRLIPPRPDWRLYYARYRLRRLLYSPVTDFGCDFKAVLSMEVKSYEPHECPICTEGSIPLVKPGSRKTAL